VELFEGAQLIRTFRWLFVPRTCTVFYVPFRNQHMMRSSLPTSHGFVPLDSQGKKVFHPVLVSESTNAFVSQFEFTGTIDNAPMLCISAALQFRDEVCGGEEKIRAYRYELAEKGEQRISEMLGTKPLAVPKGARVSFANVFLPLQVAAAGRPHSEGSIPIEDVPEVMEFFNRKLVEDYNCFMPVTFYKDAWMARISAEIYLDMDDFVYGAEVLKKLCERIRKLEYKAK
jgi:selenocysteine lyase/cysteine desulfurase